MRCHFFQTTTEENQTYIKIVSFKLCSHDTTLGIDTSVSRPLLNWFESLNHSATLLKHLKDTSNDFADAPHGVTDTKLEVNIKPV